MTLEYTFATISLAQECAYATDGDWVPGGESRRTASGPEGSSAKAFLSGAQANLVVIGLIGTFGFGERPDT